MSLCLEVAVIVPFLYSLLFLCPHFKGGHLDLPMYILPSVHLSTRTNETAFVGYREQSVTIKSIYSVHFLCILRAESEKRSKWIKVKKHLDLFHSHPSIWTLLLGTNTDEQQTKYPISALSWTSPSNFYVEVWKVGASVSCGHISITYCFWFLYQCYLKLYVESDI